MNLISLSNGRISKAKLTGALAALLALAVYVMQMAGLDLPEGTDTASIANTVVDSLDQAWKALVGLALIFVRSGIENPR